MYGPVMVKDCSVRVSTMGVPPAPPLYGVMITVLVGGPPGRTSRVT
jgi:hypothetical protein